MKKGFMFPSFYIEYFFLKRISNLPLLTDRFRKRSRRVEMALCIFFKISPINF